MKSILIICATLMFGCVSASSASPECFDPNPVMQLVQVLTGSCTTENPKTTHTTIRKNHRHKHGHRHASTTHKSHASAGVTKSPVHTENEKLYEEFKAWRDMQELYKLFNPIQH